MTQFSLKKGCLSGSTLKIIAIIAMAIDHFAASIILYGILMQQNPSFLGHPVSMTIPWWNIYQVMRFIGRIGFPVFCFLLIEGFLHTSSKKKYATRLFLFALVSEFPFDPVTLPVPRSEVSLHSGLLHEPPLGSPRLPRLHPDQPLQRETRHLPEIFLLPLLPGTPFTVRFDPSLLFSKLMA